MRRMLIGAMTGATALLATACPVPPGPTVPVVHAKGVERISLAADGSQTTSSWSSMRRPAIGANGQMIAFDHAADGLATEDDNGVVDVFVHDRDAGLTDRVSVASDGTQGTRPSSSPSMSADGRLVAFESFAAEFHPADRFLTNDVFLRDRIGRHHHADLAHSRRGRAQRRLEATGGERRPHHGRVLVPRH